MILYMAVQCSAVGLAENFATLLTAYVMSGKAMKNEVKSLKDNDVWNLIELLEGRTTMGNKWVFKTKTDADDKIERHKAHLVAQGFSQKFSTDYDETFCMGCSARISSNS